MGKALLMGLMVVVVLASMTGCAAAGRLLLLAPEPTAVMALPGEGAGETPVGASTGEAVSIEAQTPVAEGTPTAPQNVEPPLGRVAYVWDGDIWIKALPEGEPIRVTDDGRNQAPQWSPSGVWLAFRKDAQLWVVSVDGADSWAVEDGGPVDEFAWSSGDALAYVAGSGMLRLGVMTTDRATRTLVQSDLRGAGTVGQVRGLTWSPDGAWIAFGFIDASGSAPYQGLWRVSATRGEPFEVYGITGKGEVVPAGWSGDGQRILFWQGDALSASLMADGVPVYAVSAEGGLPERLFDAVLVRPGFVLPEPGGGTRVLGLVGVGRDARAPRRMQVASMDKAQISSLAVPGYNIGAPAWSPDGRSVAFVQSPDGTSSVEPVDMNRILEYRRIGRVGTRVGALHDAMTADPTFRDERPQWSTDGGTLLFARLDAERRASLWLLDAFGGAPRQAVESLGPISDDLLLYGEVAWENLYDWWPGAGGAPTSEGGLVSPLQTIEPTGAGWNRFTFPSLGVSLVLPADWQTVRVGGMVYAGPPPVQPEPDRWQVVLEVADDISPDTTGLAEGVIQHWIGLGATAFRTAYVRVGRESGVALWGLPERGIEYYAIAHGAVRHLALSPDLGEGVPGSPRLSAVGREIVNSVQWLGTDGTEAQAESQPAHESDTVQVFVVAIYDQGRLGKLIGCSDSLVAITRPVKDPADPLRSALEELLALQQRFVGEEELYNALYQSTLRVESATLVDGVATIDLAGTVRLGGACDAPRFEAQLLGAALQFPEVQQVEVRINGVPLQQFLSERG
ncbi:MAG: GerMN domain-containing protein [Anaerolineae bacterium]